MKLEEIKSKIYTQMAIHSLKKIGEDFSKTEKDSASTIKDIENSLSHGGKVAYEKLEQKAQDFYNALPEEHKRKYNELLAKVEAFKLEVKNLTEEQIKKIENNRSEKLNH